MNDLVVVTVTYNSSHLVDNFLARLLEGRSDEAHRIVVVDSGSSDAATTEKNAQTRGVQFIRSADNIGYGSGSNLGARYSRSSWIALVNPDVDTTLSDLENLASDAMQHGLQCIGPNVLNADGELQVTWHDLAAPPWRKRNGPIERGGEVFQAASVSGCCMVIERSWFEKLGGFDEAFFMFCEEIDLHKRLSEAGGRVGVSNRVKVRTPGGASSIGVTKRWSNVERAVAHVQFIGKHYTGLEAALDALWRLAIILTNPLFRPRVVSLKQFFDGINKRRRGLRQT
ncbi:glycosyltransferase [Pseudarthrobacter sp. S9]|uniref:glycosyltransferase n=1 Tax=Pseudarthrobacter sp. S9 TaxID=3418421 RepID=UPI003D046892